MNMKQTAIPSLQNNPVVSAIVENKDNVGGLFSMEEALLLQAAYERKPETMIIVKKNRYEATKLYERLKELVDNTHLFVMEESLRVQAIASSPEDRQEQIDTLIQLISNDQPKIVVTNPAGFLRYLPDKKLFEDLCFTLKTGQEIDMKQLKERLNRAGYGRVNYVETPCEFASRGGIVDIYSLEYEHPIRIEFFDTEIDSIRFFDEKTQRTLSAVNEVTIAPATDLLFSDEQIEQLKKELPEKLTKEKQDLYEEDQEILEDYIERDLRSFESYDPNPRLYWYYPYVKAASLLDYVNGKVIYSDIEQITQSIKNLNIENISFLQEMVGEHKALPKYMLFHDDVLMNKQAEKVQNFHQFENFDKPLSSGLHPVDSIFERVSEVLADNEMKYLALDEEDLKKLESFTLKNVQYVKPMYYEGFKTDDYTLYTSKELFKKAPKIIRYQKTFKESQVLNDFLELEEGDYVVHQSYGIGQYMGIVTREQGKKKVDYLHIVYAGNDDLYVPLSQFQLVRKFISKEGAGVKLSKLGSPAWNRTKARVSAKVEEIAERLVDLYSKRIEHIGYAFPKDDTLQEEFDQAFEYEPTPDQIQAEHEIKTEMEKDKPMDHLLCGDVGFGKTEVAMRCVYKAICAGKQAAVLCPTTILSMQHYQTFQKRFDYTGARVELVNRFTPAKKVKEIQQDLEDGKIDILIGTHKLLNKSFKFKDLGLLVVDEEQRFGVEQKEKIKELQTGVDVLSLSATPIPRTMQMSLIGVRTISQLTTPPAHRHPIQTYIVEKKPSVVEEVIQRELSRNGQVFYLHNRVENIYSVAKKLQKAFPGTGIAVAHGRMSRDEIEETMIEFAEGKYQILVCTSIIETGLDIANANTILIDQADHFGLSQLYQIRGRVGRREKIAYCYLMVQPEKELTEQADKRLKSIKEFTQLGSGYKVAMRDLTIRGAGDMLGPQQAGFIDQVGMDMYLDMLAEAIARKKGEPVKEAKPEKVAQISMDGYIPSQFTTNDGDKLSLYQDIKNAKNNKELIELEKRVEDLFGRIPKEVEQLFKQRALDFFVNQPGIEALIDEKNEILIRLNPDMTRKIDGVRLFGDISKVSKSVTLKLTNGRIEIRIDAKKTNSMKFLHEVITLLNGYIKEIYGENKDEN